MNILIDIGHPAHVHLFEQFTREMQQRGHSILFTVREKEMTLQLLVRFGFKHSVYMKSGKGTFRKFLSLPKTVRRLFSIIRDFDADITLSHSSVWLAQASWLAGVPNITLEDTGNAEQVLFYKPFTRVMLTPDCYPKRAGGKHLSYAGYHELFYLHPKRFQPINKSEFNKGNSYALVRFSAWDASHDIGKRRLSKAQKTMLIKQLSDKLDVFISSEGKIPHGMEQYKLSTPPEEIHRVICGARLVVSEGATIASEAGVMGVPNIYVNPLVRCYNKDLESYGLAVNITGFDAVSRWINKLLDGPSEKTEWQRRRQKMLSEKIDVTALLVWFVENYPESVRIMKEDPGYQWRFK